MILNFIKMLTITSYIMVSDHSILCNRVLIKLNIFYINVTIDFFNYFLRIINIKLLYQ